MTDAPSVAWIETHDGERVECLIECVQPGVWQATPVRDVDVREIAEAHVDLLPPASEISFVLLDGEAE